MTPSAAVADTILADPRPLLFLDTCVLLDAVRAPSRRTLGSPAVRAARHLLSALGSSPPGCHLVASHILPTEFGHNLAAARADCSAAASACDLVLEVAAGLNLVSGPPPGAAAVTPRLVELAEQLRDSATILPDDPTCLRWAFERVLGKQQPGQSGGVKDAYLIAQCFELVASLRGRGFAPRCAFSSSNTRDFANPNSTRVHDHLSAEFSRLGLEYFVSLHAAVGSLRLGLPTSPS